MGSRINIRRLSRPACPRPIALSPRDSREWFCGEQDAQGVAIGWRSKEATPPRIPWERFMHTRCLTREVKPTSCSTLWKSVQSVESVDPTALSRLKPPMPRMTPMDRDPEVQPLHLRNRRNLRPSELPVSGWVVLPLFVHSVSFCGSRFSGARDSRGDRRDRSGLG